MIKGIENRVLTRALFFRKFYSLYIDTKFKNERKIIMEKVINFAAIKTNRAEMKEKRAAKKAERKAKKEAEGKKPVGKTVGLVGTYVAAAGAGAAVATAVIKALQAKDAPIEMPEPEMAPVMENSVETETEVTEV